jgi:hypothetical protein
LLFLFTDPGNLSRCWRLLFTEADDDFLDLSSEFEWSVVILAHRRARVLADVEGFIQRETNWHGAPLEGCWWYGQHLLRERAAAASIKPATAQDPTLWNVAPMVFTLCACMSSPFMQGMVAPARLQ